MADPYSPLPPLSSGEDRKMRELQHTTYVEAELHFIDKRGNIIAGYLFFSICGFYLYKMYIDKKIT